MLEIILCRRKWQHHGRMCPVNFYACLMTCLYRTHQRPRFQPVKTSLMNYTDGCIHTVTEAWSTAHIQTVSLNNANWYEALSTSLSLKSSWGLAYNWPKAAKCLLGWSFPSVSQWHYSTFSSLYHLAAIEHSLPCNSVLCHSELREWRGLHSMGDTVSPCQAQLLPLLPLLAADDFGRLPHSAPARLIKNPPVSFGPQDRICHNC